ncbi:pre-mRNA-splicing factor ATP-dependent RNA helicase-like protein PRP2 [Metschnikowia aff. pulcherrima]|uniref:RNA helicase n=1 Tax=Metschnikowia aff. pulcherrima TaxID=2163413 RepID=A0A4P6XJ47_9ASCO|nr:pre-mRNA-splicing factor ATP-dependent RNA helicase-like protein PRP2 [Metschnikowia aff. pulcherrima]
MSTQTGRGYKRRAAPEAYEDEAESGEAPQANNSVDVSHEQDEDPAENPMTSSTECKPSESRGLSQQATKPQILPEERVRRSFESQVKKLTADVNWLSAKTDLTPRQASELREKSELLQDIKYSTPEQHYERPDTYASDGYIDRKRKRDLLKPLEEISSKENEKKSRYDNQWELDQMKKAHEIVSLNPDQIQLPDQPEYEFVFDEAQFVDFSEEAELAGEEGENIEPPSRYADIREVRRSLPAYRYRQRFLDAMSQSQVLIVVGETGSGKTTQLPQYLYEDGYATLTGNLLKIGCTQPRRVAATSVAQRVADEVGCPLGQDVGYSVRFENKLSKNTAIKYLTDGMLLREFLTDPLLSSYSALMIDEAHERTVSTEIVLSLLKDVIKERNDLKLIVASATINAQKFADYFNGAEIFTIPGRRFPVDICYTKNPEANYIQAAITTVFQIHTKHETPGDILVFLTGQEEIETMAETLNDACDKLGSLIKPLIVAPIYANLPPAQQAKIFEPTPPNARKVVLATNIAETSITINGTSYVIDPGYVKENVFNPTTGMESLVVVPCSKASADQRAGRAGRVGPGKCYRLYTKWSFQNELQANPTPEILRVNLCGVVLLLLSMGINDLVNFDFMDPPSKETLMKALELLYALGAMNAKGQLTKTGRKMAEFPIDPMFCKALLTSSDYGVLHDVLNIISMLSESSSLFYRPKDKKELADKRKQAFNHPAGDHLTLLNIWRQWKDLGFSNLWCEDNFLQYRTLKRTRDIRQQLEGLCSKVGIDLEEAAQDQSQVDEEKIQKSLLSGFFPNLARLSKLGNNYVLLKRKHPVYIHPSSGLSLVKPPPKLVLYHELVLTSKEYMRNCMRVEEKWVDEVARHYYSEKDLGELNPKRPESRA